MTELKPAPSRRNGQMIVPPRKKVAEPSPEPQKPPVVVTEEPKATEIELPRRINLAKNTLDVLRSEVPGRVFRQPPFTYDPRPFAVESERLNSRIMSADIQKNSLRQWIRNPTAPINYCVSGSPDDSKAAYFAAYLLAVHIKHLGSRATPVWETLYGGYAEPDVMNRSENLGAPTILVIHNLAINSVSSKIGKAQDLIERFPNIPKIIVAAGEDPISFMSMRLFKAVQGVAYFSESIVKRSFEVI